MDHVSNAHVCKPLYLISLWSYELNRAWVISSILQNRKQRWGHWMNYSYATTRAQEGLEPRLLPPKSRLIHLNSAGFFFFFLSFSFFKISYKQEHKEKRKWKMIKNELGWIKIVILDYMLNDFLSQKNTCIQVLISHSCTEV